MRWSFSLFQFRKISVRVHATFFLLLVWIAVSEAAAGATPVQIMQSVGFILALFVCVILHEFGHALTAARFGIATRDITLLPIGGLARLERMPEEPRRELAVALAGPAVNLVIALILYLIVLIATGPGLPTAPALMRGDFLVRLLTVNIALVVFNLLPAFPMDGGRILRALLALRVSYAQATSAAATIGQGLALALGFLGFFGNPFLILIAVFVWIGAAQEANMAQMRTYFAGTVVREVTVTEFHTVQGTDTLGEVMRILLSSSQKDFPVLDGDRLIGILSREALTKALPEHGESGSVKDSMSTEVHTVEAGETLLNAFTRMQETGVRTMVVTQRGNIYGLLTTENLGEYIAIKSAMSTKDRGPRVAWEGPQLPQR